jgi:hypothetical protein
LVALVALAPGPRGAEFVNLTFDEPDSSRITPGPGQMVAPIDAAFRGWTLQWDYELDPLLYPLPPSVGVGDGDAPVGLIHSIGSDGMARYGAYRAVINIQWAQFGPLRPPLHLFQTGTVPAGAELLHIYYPGPSIATDPVHVLVNGQERTLNPSFIRWPDWRALDVSPYAGQEIKLEFLFPAGGIDYRNHYEFDIAGFTAVPEPGVWALLGLGGAAFVARRWRPR